MSDCHSFFHTIGLLVQGGWAKQSVPGFLQMFAIALLSLAHPMDHTQGIHMAVPHQFIYLLVSNPIRAVIMEELHYILT